MCISCAFHCFYREIDNLSLAEILDNHLKKYPNLSEEGDYFNSVHVRRNNIWKDALRAITKPSFTPTNRMRVTFIGEPAVDEGGPRREFFTLALGKMVEDRALFSGPPNCKVFVHNVQGIRNNIFYYAGLFVALSIVNGGAGLECLSETVYNYICHGLTPGKLQCTIDEIPDGRVKDSMLKVQLRI